MTKCQTKRCIRQFVLIVVRNVKFHSSLTPVGPCTAVSAGQKEEAKGEDTRLVYWLLFENLFSNIFP